MILIVTNMYKCVVPIKNNRTRTGAIHAFTEGLYQLADNVYSWMVPNGSWGESNHGLNAGDNRSILIDTDWEYVGQKLIDEF